MTTKKEEEKYEEVKSNFVKFNKVDDYVKGSLISIVKPTQPDQWGKMKKIFTLKASEGSFHGNDENKVVDKDATIVAENSLVRVSLGETSEQQMANIKLGQKVIIKLVELRPTKKGNPAKIYKVLAGPMDEDALAEIEGRPF